MDIRKSRRLAVLAAAIAIMVSGCGTAAGSSKSDTLKNGSHNGGSADMGSGNIEFGGESINVKGTGVSSDGTSVKISAGGEYTFTGSLNSGQIVVDADSDVSLILNGMSIANEKEETLYIENGDVTIKVMEGTENTITSGSEGTSGEISEDADGSAVFAKDDLTITGSGKLNVNGYINNGIQSKDKLYIEGGEIKVVSSNDGIKGKEGVYASGGNISITSGGDGIQSNADMDISGGEFNIVSGGGAKDLDIQTQNRMPDGMERPEMGEMPEGMEKPEMGEMPEGMEKPEMGEMPESMEKPEMGEVSGGKEMPEKGEVPDGWKKAEKDGASEDSEDSDAISTKGIKAEGNLSISAGTFLIDSLDDSVHSNKAIEISGGEFTINTADDGVHADEKLAIKSGKVNIEKCNEGLEAVNVVIDGGEFNIKSADDGINANGGSSGFPPTGTDSEGEMPVITINAGTIYIDAEGDGLDSNGNIYINSGDIIVNGSSNGGNSAIDYGTESGGECMVSGGTVVATGYSDMAETFDSEGSKQCSVLYVFDNDVPAGTEIQVIDGDGKNVMSYTTVKKCDSVIFSSPELGLNKTYTVKAGEESGTIDVTENAVSNKAGGRRWMGR